MNQTEGELSGRLRQAAKQRFDKTPILWRRIEDASGNLGTPDVFAIIDQQPVWIELKVTDTAGAKPQMRRGQAAFGEAVRQAGGRSLVAIGTKGTDHVRIVRGWTQGDDWRSLMIYEGSADLICAWHLVYD